MNKTKVKMNKPLLPGLLTFDISFDIKQKYGNSVKLCYMDTDNTCENKRCLCRPCERY